MQKGNGAAEIRTRVSLFTAQDRDTYRHNRVDCTVSNPPVISAKRLEPLDYRAELL